MFTHLRDQLGQSDRPRWLQRSRFEQRAKDIRFHAITADDLLKTLPAESKLAVNLPFFERLRDSGRSHAHTWLAAHSDKVGRESSLDLGLLFY